MPEPFASSADAELRAHVERVLTTGYELDREIGRGGMGIVYRARDRRLKRHVAIKLLPPELAFRSEIRSRFLREAETAAQLSHPHIVPIYSVDEREGLVYFVMAYVDGENLAVRLHNQGAFAPDETRRILLETSRALAYAHERGVVHRDIKPDNILLSADSGRVMVTDFGIARAITEGADSRLTATGMAIGTPAYMSPEQTMGEREIDGRSDLYSLGVVGYQMLSGELPFNATNTPALLVKHLSERPAPLEERCPSAPSDLCRAIMMLLEKEPANRFPSAGALATALETGDVPAIAGGEPHSAAAGAAMLARPAAPPYAAGQSALRGDQDSTPEEVTRWYSTPVIQFRKKLAPFFAFGVVSIVLAIFNVLDVLWITGIWSVFLAFQYARLWTDGYDWHDVFKEPRDRLFFDVVAEWMDNVRAVWDKKKRVEVRERSRLRSRHGPALFTGQAPSGASGGRGALLAGATASSGASRAGEYAPQVREARRLLDEVMRQYDSLSRSDRDVVSEVAGTANALYDRVQAIAVHLAEMDRSAPTAALAPVEQEITRLEAEANPLDLQGSEERVRRLAYLKRQRRALSDVAGKRAQAREKLERCLLALDNMRLDLVRLKAGGQTAQQVTLVAEKAMSLAREVDTALYVQEEMAKLGLGVSGERGTGSGKPSAKPKR